MKRGCWLRKGPSPPRGLAHPSGGRPVRTRVVAHPCATWANPRGDDVPAGVGVVALIDAAKARPTLHGRSRSRWPVAIAREERTTRSLPHRCRCRCRHRRCRQPRRNKATPIPITEDVVLSHGGASSHGWLRPRGEARMPVRAAHPHAAGRRPLPEPQPSSFGSCSCGCSCGAVIAKRRSRCAFTSHAQLERHCKGSTQPGAHVQGGRRRPLAPLSRPPAAPGRSCACPPAARPRSPARTTAAHPRPPRLRPSPRAP